jgi:hypothetical protein
MVIIHREELLDDLLSLLVELELPDAVVVESRSGLELLERDLPIFAGLRSLIPAGIDFSRLVLCPIENDDGLDILRQIGKLTADTDPEQGPPSSAFLLPIAAVKHF